MIMNVITNVTDIKFLRFRANHKYLLSMFRKYICYWKKIESLLKLALNTNHRTLKIEHI